MSEKSTPGRLRAAFREQPSWKRRLHAIAGVVLVLGLAMQGVAMITRGGAQGPVADSAVGLDVVGKTSAKVVGTGTLPRTGLLPGAEPGFPPRTPDGRSDPPSRGGEGGAGSTPAGGSGEAPPFLDEWSPTLVKGGLSFFVAFWIGFLIRVFATVCGLFVGLFGLGLLGLQQLGWLTVEWSVAQAHLGALPDLIAAQFGGFKSFLQGSLPSAGMAGLGLFAGLKKK